MLENITVKNFKGIKNLEIEHLSKLTLIGGKNNCGKTSLMEAMFMQFDRMNPHITIRQSLARGVSVIPTEPEFMWAPIFNEFNLSKKIVIEYKDLSKDTFTYNLIQFKKINTQLITK